MPKYILINEKMTPIRITPEELENIGKRTYYRKGRRERHNIFRTNHHKIIEQFCKIYETRYAIKKIINQKIKRVELSIPTMGIQIIAEANSVRKAKRSLFFKLIKIYTKRIINSRNEDN